MQSTIESGASRSPAGARRGWRVAGLLSALLFLWLTFRNVDPASTLRVLRELGALSLLAFVPSLLAAWVESVAWQHALSSFTARPGLRGLLHVRIVTDSFGAVLPLGAVWADAIKPALLERYCGLPLGASLAGIAARKYLLIMAQGLYVLLAFALGHQVLFLAFENATGFAALAFAVPLAALPLLAAAEGMARVLGGGRSVARLLAGLKRVRLERLRAALAGLDREVARGDNYAASFFSARRRTLLPLALVLGVWLLEATETWLVLWLMGARLDWHEALAIEATVVYVRHALCVLPAGLGVQDFGYATLLGALGVGLDQCAAFVLLKRVREFAWAGLGYALYVADSGVSARVRAASPV